MDIEIKAIDQAAVRALLDSDDAGRAPTVRIDEEGGSPLRCCLGKAEPGERIALLSYAPLRRWAAGAGVDPGAYDEVGPIFVHAGPCPGFDGTGWPDAHRAPRMLRSYAADGHILGGRRVGEGADPEVALKELFDDPEVAVVHVRAIEFGCFQFEARRAI
ncbi:DUF1203 domain-containing protein [Nonomuraea sp. NBC_01738]|uniref:DUF1203 domain-containing protein n=1 Tax=Nonomuraea sp. NBC_01738 TaxID=2976003 RepID=UPI002E14FAF2|nr:DUF1203 domain-containing protein [Nonomuraea sp. NBC_01738]